MNTTPAPTPAPKITCAVCGKAPEAIDEYVEMAEMEGYASATAFVLDEEGTYNPENHLFYCTSDYIRIGMPLGKAQVQK